MLGRYCSGGCACRDCGGGQPDTRWRKRVEARELERKLAPETDLEWLASLQPSLYDLSDCQHGCNGWPCGSERCTFVCHEGLPVETYWDGDYLTFASLPP